MAYKFTDTNKVNDEFTKVFGIGFKPFYDGLVSVATKRLWIDILKFDEWLQKKHGNYKDDGKSMNDVIREHYGDKGVELVNELTGEDDEENPKSDKRETTKGTTKPQGPMDQKTINERVAMAMLRQCALVWELWMKNPNEGEFKFSDVWQGLSARSRTRLDSKTGMVFLEPSVCQYPDVFDKKIQEIDGVEGYTPDGHWTSVRMFFPTSDTDPNMGFGCSYPLTNVFGIARDFCLGNGCQALMNKMVFGYTDKERWARLPEVKETKTKTKTITKTTAPKKDLKPEAKREPTLEERLREALLRQFNQMKIAA